MVRPQDSKAGMSHIILETIGRILEVDMRPPKKSNKQEGAQDGYTGSSALSSVLEYCLGIWG